MPALAGTQPQQAASGAGPLPAEPCTNSSLMQQQQQQLSYFHDWAASLAATPVQSVPLTTVLSCLRVVVTGLPEGATAEELEAHFNELASTHGAAVAPGRAVASCTLQQQQQQQHPGSGPVAAATLQLRCAVEASNCMAFDGVQLRGAALKVARPEGYIPEAAVLLGPTQPRPGIAASLAAGGSAATAAAAAACEDAPPHVHSVAGGAAALRGAAPPAGAAAASAAASAACGNGLLPFARGQQQQQQAAAAAAKAAAGAAGAPRGDLLLQSCDQTKADEVFIGGLPSHWKAQQLKELLAPYGTLKSLSVAMDASTGKNKGYAFVVFASPEMVPAAIEELDCRVVEGKILAVQRATDGKGGVMAAAGGYGRDASGGGGSDVGSGARDGGAAAGASLLPHHAAAGGGRVPAVVGGDQAALMHPPPPLAPPALALRHHHARSSSTGSGLGLGLGLPPHMPPSELAAAAAAALGAASGHHHDGGHTRSHSGGGHGASGLAAFSASAGGSSGGGAASGPLPPALGLAPDGPHASSLPSAAASLLGGPRVPSGPPLPSMSLSGGGSTMHGPSGPSSTKQYDVNELYIGDLPLTWDEDAVRRLLGRFGRIKYFTLRNGRDKNFAFCKFKDSSVVDAAIAGLHGKIVDGYFLNVRRAVEGKQQAAAAAAAQQAAHWGGGGAGAHHHNKQQQQQQGAAGGMHFHHQQQQQQQRGGPAGPRSSLDAASGGGRMAGGVAGLPHSGANHHMRSVSSSDQLQHPSLATKSLPLQHAVGRLGGPAAAAAHPQQQQQPLEAASGSSTAPSTPGTPTAPQEQQQAEAAQQALHPGGGGNPAFGPFSGPQFLPRSGAHQAHQALPAASTAPYLQQQQHHMFALQQQQQQARLAFNGPLPPAAPPAGSAAAMSLFGQPQCPASWPGTAALQQQAPAPAGAGAADGLACGGGLAGPFGGSSNSLLGASLAGKLQAAEPLPPAASGSSQAPARAGLLQTWDLLSPWSLFSNAAQ